MKHQRSAALKDASPKMLLLVGISKNKVEGEVEVTAIKNCTSQSKIQPLKKKIFLHCQTGQAGPISNKISVVRHQSDQDRCTLLHEVLYNLSLICFFYIS